MKKQIDTAETAVEEESSRDASLARKALLEAVEGTTANDADEDLHSPRPFINLFVSKPSCTLIRSGTIRAQRQLLYKTIQSFNKASARRFFAGLHLIVDALLESETFVTNPDTPNTLHYAAMSIKAYVSGLLASRTSSKLNLIDETFAVARNLHDAIFELNFCEETQATIVSMCEVLWLAGVPNRDHLILQALPHLAALAAGHAQEAIVAKDVKRLYAMREALQVVDFADNSCGELCRLLQSLAKSPLCLKTTEGIKLLAYMLQCDADLRKHMHLAIRSQIRQQKSIIVKVYGEVYLLAWKGLADDDECAREEIQDLIGQYILCMLHAKNPTLHANLLSFMIPFHQQQKKSVAVEDLLHRLYGPLLWRSLEERNSQVRLHGTKVLAQVFPLQDGSHCRTEQSIRDACKALLLLLQDSHPSVRMAASEASAAVLGVYWTVLPTETMHSILNYVVTNHVSDASSYEVRARAVQTVSELLRFPRTIGVLRPILPHVGNLIHDKVEKVRLAVVKMLNLIKTEIPGISYYHVVPEANLVGQLKQEGQHNSHGPVAIALAGLMADTFLPQGVDASGTTQSETIICFLSTHPSAARVFFSNIAQHMTTNSVVGFICKLFKLLNHGVWTELKAKTGDSDGPKDQKRRRFKTAHQFDEQPGHRDGQEDDSVSGGKRKDVPLPSAVDTQLMASLTETIDTLWQSIEKALSQKDNEVLHDLLVEKFSGDPLMVILAHFEKKAHVTVVQSESEALQTQEDCHRVCAAILRIAGRLPQKAIRGLVSHIAKKLKTFSTVNASKWTSQQATASIALLCLWNMTEQVGISLAASIESEFEQDHCLHYETSPMHSRKRRAGERTNKNAGKSSLFPELPPLLALSVLGDIFRGSNPSSITARKSLLESVVASAAIQRALQRAIRYAELVLTGTTSGTINEAELKIILLACEMFGRFALHKEALYGGGKSFNDDAHQLLDWTTKRVVPAFSLSTDDIGFNTLSSAKPPSSPMSPIATGPPRRRTNRNMTPSKEGADSSASTSLASTRDKESAVAVARAFAVSMLQASCIIFSEWLAVGCAGGVEITEAAVCWTKIFCIERGGIEAQTALLPAFSRLAVQLTNTAQNNMLLKSLLLECSDDNLSESDHSLHELVCMLLSPRRASTTASTVEVVVEAALEVVSRRDMNGSQQRHVSVNELCSFKTGSIKTAVVAILSCRQACVELAKYLVNKLDEQSEPNCNESTQFMVSLLSLVCEQERIESSEAILSAMRKISDTEWGMESQEIAPDLEDGVTA
ncbi:hypothetical protein MPSEU_000995800 [Mayamaea pseudoterrestris]|nr:hypothetical protein MPSEU_000995800 [Mayamaea pseudoterrestris]